MPRIPLRSVDELSMAAREALGRFEGDQGARSNLLRTLAHRPAIMTTLAEHAMAIFQTGTVARRLKEMLAVRVSQINDCFY
jgi:alkylhydroperoxidase family enzyme